ncbi:hypothetical protein NQ314_017516 [Rhamnusium bicolor]|uniref:Cuticle protein 6 n=1 Tax=Rhamnusium bicolor TaxID=1586634 RepID=A0AAV8WT63_9CUCU|nr:hypothetical protein NQ314_017516 [Rhamnusium bicolor]
MQLFIAVSALLAVAAAKPSGIAAPFTIAAPISSQYHAQDELGQYSYGYSNGLSAKSEVRSADGITVGGYKYVDAEGKLQSVEYSSDGVHGFRVAASNLPVAPPVPAVPALPQPLPVQDTPEVRSVEVVAPVAAISTIALPSLSPLISAAPAVAVKSAIAPALEIKSPATPIVEVSTLAPAAEETPVAPTVEVKSAIAPAAEVKSEVAPTVAVNSLLAPTVAVKSFIAPAFSVGAAPLVAAPLAYGYSINSIPSFGFNSAIIAQPAITSYTAPFGAQLLSFPLNGTVVPAEQSTAAKVEANESSE